MTFKCKNHCKKKQQNHIYEVNHPGWHFVKQMSIVGIGLKNVTIWYF